MKKLENKLKWIIISSILIRMIYFFAFSVDKNENFWEYGEIARNIVHGNGYSLFYFENDKLEYKYKEGVNPYPSAYMPPAYTIFILPFILIPSLLLQNLLIVLIQSLLSGLLVYLIYRYTRINFSEKTALVAAAIAAFLPEFIFAANSVGPTVFYHLLIMIILLILMINDWLNKLKYSILLGLLFGFLIYLRPESLIFLGFIAIVFLIKRRPAQAGVLIIIPLLMLVPWQLRNYSVFNSVTTITTSGGLNFYRGHNPYRPGVWSDDSLFSQLKSYSGSRNFEIIMNKLYYEKALKSIKSDPEKEISISLEKLTHLWLYNRYDRRTTHPAYIIPWLLLLMLSLVGLIKSLELHKFKYVYLFLIYHSILAVIFFALPRYQTMMKVLLIPFAAYGIEQVIRYFKMEK